MAAALAEMQRVAKRNADDLRDELADLAKWEVEMQKKNEALKHKKTTMEVDLPPIRGSAPPKQEAQKQEKSDDPVQTYKMQGNEYFKKGGFDDATRCYSKGIDLDPLSASSHVLYANRAMCFIKQQKWDLAEKDASTCIQMNRSYAKAFFRRALARRAMGKLEDARSDAETALVLTPGDAETEKLSKSISELAKVKKSVSVAAPKKKLVIEEVSDDSDLDADKSNSKRTTEEVARQKRQEEDREAALKAEEARAAAQRQEALNREAARSRERQSDSRVEVLDSDEEEVSPKPKRKVHADPVLRPSESRKCWKKDDLKIPVYFADFEKTYNSLKSSQPDMLTDYFGLLPDRKWKALFGSSMTADIVCDILRVGMMSDSLLPNFLKNLLTVDRLDEVVMLFSSDEQKIWSRALQKAESSLSHSVLQKLRDLE